MFTNRTDKLLFQMYRLLWWPAVPLLKSNQRLRQGFDQRTLSRHFLRPADVWIQAASVGEAYLSKSLLKRFCPPTPVNVLITTNTDQGLHVLNTVADGTGNHMTTVSATYFPFDRPRFMEQALDVINPKLMILLETELWPGLLHALKNRGVPSIIINGRLTEKSARHYNYRPDFWRAIRPRKVMAVSVADEKRFGVLFGTDIVTRMPNIKLDLAIEACGNSVTDAGIGDVRERNRPLIVLGSIRKAEETDIGNIISRLASVSPDALIALFPRHIHRLKHWKATLDHKGISWVLRSGTTGTTPSARVILWDTFGELTAAYADCDAAFVGGSLAPLGGQNFMEPLIQGIKPVIGPHWDNFLWIGEDVFHSGLVRRVPDWKSVADQLLEDATNGYDKTDVRRRALDYIRKRSGGSDMACLAILEQLGYS
ncbi:MAG: 3-deoxy-D-manno-octulosonic acid transferase [Desulfobacteraceae bacterium]|nr:3-deoxy-D-manno-octulosonic acid transferase [Desulfobacteraceae bacterium]